MLISSMRRPTRERGTPATSGFSRSPKRTVVSRFRVGMGGGRAADEDEVLRQRTDTLALGAQPLDDEASELPGRAGDDDFFRVSGHGEVPSFRKGYARMVAPPLRLLPLREAAWPTFGRRAREVTFVVTGG